MLITLNEIKNISEEKINSLKENQVAEDKHLEYKLTLPSEKYDDKKEFLADVSSFANADGGVIFYGIKAKDGILEDIPGLDIDNLDAEILRLENLLRTSIEPRIIGTYFHPFKLSNGKTLIVAHVPKSFNPPHVVNYQGHWKFYSRNSAGKYPLDVSELKSIISLSTTVQERIRNFRLERISRIKNRDLQIPISDEPKFIYHLVPLSAFATDTSIDLAKFENSDLKYKVFYELKKIYNYEGIFIHNSDGTYPADWYMQIFRSGTIEILNSRVNPLSTKILDYYSFEKDLIDSVNNNKIVFDFFGVNYPMIIFHTVLDIKDFRITPKLGFRDIGKHQFDQSDFLLPEILLTEDQFDILPLALKPLFDPIWNAAGYPQSPNFNTKGEWTVKG